MVVSVFGGTVAFSGSAVATGNVSSSFAGNVYAGGEDAKITVTDSNAAGNDQKIEKLGVTVSAPVHGDSESVTLEETAKDSATFEGSITTEVVSNFDEIKSGNGLIEGFGGDPITITEEKYDASATLDAKAGAPSITDADIVGMRDGNTTVRVDFSEPVQMVDASDFEFTGSGSVEWVTPNTGQNGYVELTFNREIQTGTSPELVVQSSSYTDLAGIENSEEDRLYVDSVELNLDKGMNFVSAPFETGGVGFSAMEEKGLLDNVDVVWAYDQSSSGENHWVSYDPDADENELEWFQGGQGYVFVADKSDEIDLRSYTKYADNDDSDNVPAVPETEQIEPGWNLVGHYHEGSQTVDTAFGFNYDTDVGVFGQMDDGSMDYVGEANAGEAYWVFTRDSYGLYTPKQDDGGSQTDEMSLSIDNVEITNDDDDKFAENGENVTVTATASDADGVYSLMFGASEIGADSIYHHEPEKNQYVEEFTVDVKDTEGNATIPVIAEDVYGEEKQVEATVKLDTASPDVSNVQISDATDDDGVVANDDSVQITAEVSDGASGVDSVSADASAFGAGTATLIDDGSPGDETADDGTYSATITVGSSGSAAEGEQSVTVSATDVADNGGSQAVASGTLMVDNVQPSASWADTFQNSEVDGSVDLTSHDTSTDADSTTYEYGDAEQDSWTEITSPGSWDTTGLEDGDVDVRVTAKDAQGNSDSATATVTINNNQASASWADTFQNSEVSGSVNLADSANTEYADTTSYAYSTNGGTDWTSISDGSSWATGELDDGDVKVRVTVTDAQSGEDSATTTVTVDNVEPSATKSSSFPSSEVTDTVDVTSWFDVSKDGGTATYAYQHADDSSWTDITGTPSSFDTTGLSDGDVEFRVTVDDGEGNSATASGTVTVNNDQPTASWDNTNFEVSGTYDLTTDSTVENQDSTSYAYSLDDGSSWTAIDDGSSWDTTQLNDGDVMVRVTASDDQSSADATETTTVTINNDASIDSASINNPTQSSSATKNTDESLTVNYDAEDTNFDSATVELVNGDTTVATASGLSSGTSQTTTIDLSSGGQDVSAGTYSVELTVTDSAGNSKTVTETDAVTVDDGNIDTLAINSPTASSPTTVSAGDSVTVDYNVDDANFDSATVELVDESGTSQASADISSAGDSTVGVDTTGLAAGDYDVVLTVDDAASNSESTTETAAVTVDDGNIDSASINSPTQSSPVTKNTGETLTVDYNADDTNFDSATVELVDGGGNTVATASGLSSGTDQTTTIDLSSSGQDVTAGTYSVKLTVDDSAGNSKTVTETDAVTVDDGNIDTMSINSPTNANPTVVNEGDQVTVDYNVDDANFDSATVELVDSGSTTQATEQISSAGDSTVTFDTAGFAADDYDVVLTVNDAAGNSESTTETAAVTVDDGAAPSYDSASKADDTTIDVTLSDGGSGLDKASITADDFSLSDGSIANIDKSGVTDGATGTQTVTINLDSAVDTSSVDVDIVSAIDDKAGNSLSSGSKTVSDMDGVSPTYDSASKTDDTTIEVTLSDGGSGLNPNTIEQSDFGVSSGSISSIDATSISSGDASGTVTVNLDSAVDTSSVDVTIEGSIEDVAGNALTSGSNTANNMDGIAPTMSSATAEDTGGNADQVDQVTVTFSEGVTGIEQADYTVTNTNTQTDYTIDSVSHTDGESTVTFTVQESGSTDTSDTIEVSYTADSGSNSVTQDSAGNQLSDGATITT